MRRSIKWIVIPLSVFLIAGCGQVEKWYYCGYGLKSAQDKNHESALGLLDQCLELESLLPEQRAFYLQTRAWTHFSLDNYARALRDQEKSFTLVAPTTHKEFVNHGVYLRMAGKSLESLEPLMEAEKLDERAGRTSMLTQYNLGWSLYDLGRYEAAISAFTRGIESQPDYPFAYFRRGLSYDRTGRVDEAESDFAEFVAIFEYEEVEFNERFSTELRETAEKYSELKVLLKAPN